MKRILALTLSGLLLAALCSSCAATKRDCNGRKHTRLSNGIYL